MPVKREKYTSCDGKKGMWEEGNRRISESEHIGREYHIPQVLCIIDDRFTTVVSIDLS
jgi:hypothetical protein